MKRRTFVTGALASLTALFVDQSRAAEPRPGQARHLIVLWMNGGPSHVDTFDPKRGGPFRAIPTRVPDLSLCEHLPGLADQAQHLTVIRSLSSKEGNHDRARYLGHTGYAPNPTVAHPSLAAWIAADRAPIDLPSYVSIGGPGHGGGFLGVQHAPLVLREAGTPPAHTAAQVGGARRSRREKALAYVEDAFAATTADPALSSRRAVHDRATAMMAAPSLAAFDLDAEPEATRRAYGDGDFGRGCLVARRLVEVGVPVVEVTLDGWDTHTDNENRTRALMKQLDPAMSSLVADLAARELLDETVVLWMGEFGRTPGLNGREGRDHHPRAFSAVVAGGGFAGGRVHGATDAQGETVVAGHMGVPDLFATISDRLGLDPTETRTAPGGRPIARTDQGSVMSALLRP